jgi:hypothetical protein
LIQRVDLRPEVEVVAGFRTSRMASSIRATQKTVGSDNGQDDQ